MEQALNQDLSYLMGAYYGYQEVLTDIFGSGDSQQPQSQQQQQQPVKDARGDPIMITPSIFDQLFEEPEGVQ